MTSVPQRPVDPSATAHDRRVRVPGFVKALARRLRYVPTERHMWLRRFWFAPQEASDRMRGLHDPQLPPRWLRIVGRGDFRATGQTMAQHFVQLGALEPHDAVLDVGCGVGRMALPLTRVLQGEGRYEGFDANAEAVRWSQRHITERYPHFRFQCCDIRNSRYNPRGRIDPTSFRFPFPSDAFDFVIVTSVFTHMAVDGVEQYVTEIARVLRPGGTLFATFFLIDDEARRRVEAEQSQLRFVRHRPDAGQWTHLQRLGDADYLAAQDEPVVNDLLARAGLRMQRPVHWGSWSGRTPATDYQDIVIAHRDVSKTLGP